MFFTINALVIYIAIGLCVTLWADWKASQIGVPGCPSVKAGIITSLIWLPLVARAIAASYMRNND